MTPEEVLLISAPIEDPKNWQSRPYLIRDPDDVSLEELLNLNEDELKDYAIASQTLAVYRGFPLGPEE